MKDEYIRRQMLEQIGELQKEEEIIYELEGMKEIIITEDTSFLTLLCC